MVLLDQLFTYLLHCPNFSNERLTFFNKLQSIDENTLSKDNSNISKCLSLANIQLINDVIILFLIAIIKYIISTKRFDLCCIKIDTYLFVYEQIIFSFYQEIFCSFILFSFAFSMLTIAFLRLFCNDLH